MRSKLVRPCTFNKMLHVSAADDIEVAWPFIVYTCAFISAGLWTCGQRLFGQGRREMSIVVGSSSQADYLRRNSAMDDSIGGS